MKIKMKNRAACNNWILIAKTVRNINFSHNLIDCAIFFYSNHSGSMIFKMVEVAGVEPASEATLTSSHSQACLIYYHKSAKIGRLSNQRLLPYCVPPTEWQDFYLQLIEYSLARLLFLDSGRILSR